MDIQEIKTKVDLLKMSTLQDTVLIKDVAKELNTKTTDLMQFIIDNKRLFQTEEIWSYKKESYIEYTRFGKSRKTRTVQNKCMGLGIKDVFLNPEDNYETDEWLAKQKNDHEFTVWTTDWNNYGRIEGQYVKEDIKSDRDKLRKHLWRNTSEKINKLIELGILTEKNFYIGGAFDCTEHIINTALTENSIQKASEAGWTIL